MIDCVHNYFNITENLHDENEAMDKKSIQMSKT